MNIVTWKHGPDKFAAVSIEHRDFGAFVAANVDECVGKLIRSVPKGSEVISITHIESEFAKGRWEKVSY